MLFDVLCEIRMPSRHVLCDTAGRIWDRRIASGVIGKFPGENVGMVSITGHNLGGIVLESVNQSLIGEELVVFLRTPELADIEIHTTIVIAQRASWKSIVCPIGDVPPAETEVTERVGDSGISGVISQWARIPVVSEGKKDVDPMLLSKVHHLVQFLEAIGAIIDG